MTTGLKDSVGNLVKFPLNSEYIIFKSILNYICLHMCEMPDLKVRPRVCPPLRGVFLKNTEWSYGFYKASS